MQEKTTLTLKLVLVAHGTPPQHQVPWCRLSSKRATILRRDVQETDLPWLPAPKQLGDLAFSILLLFPAHGMLAKKVMLISMGLRCGYPMELVYPRHSPAASTLMVKTARYASPIQSALVQSNSANLFLHCVQP